MTQILSKWWFWFFGSILLYINTVNHEYTIDDIIVVESNKLTQQGIEAIPEIFQHSYLYGYDGREDESYRPLTLSTFAIERSFFDADPKVSHFIQVLLYGLCVLLLFKWLSKLYSSDNHLIAILVCLLFMIHPLHTEVVANVKSRDELLAALFLFGALLSFLKWRENNNKIILVLSLVCYFMAMLSKETAVLGILIFPAIQYFSSKDSVFKIVKETWVFAVPFGFYFLLRQFALSDLLIGERIDPVANSLALSSTYGEQLMGSIGLISKYLQLFFAPVNLSWDYSVATFESPWSNVPAVFIGSLFLLGLLFLLVQGIRKRNVLAFGALFFLATFMLTSNIFFLINCTLGERFFFLPSLGLILLVVHVLSLINFKLPKFVFVSFISVVSMLSITRTLMRNVDWKDNLSIYEAGVLVCPNSVKTNFNLATEYLQQGVKSKGVDKKIWFNKSLNYFNKAQNIYPRYVNIYENKAFVLIELGKISTDSFAARQNFSKANVELGRALYEFEFRKKGLFQNKFYALDRLIALTNDPSEKRTYLKDMIRTLNLIEDKDSDDYKRLIYYLNELGDAQTMITEAEIFAKAFKEESLYLNLLAEQLFKENKIVLSRQISEIYVKYHPEDLSAKSNLGMLYEMSGENNKAIMIYEEILKIDPNAEHTRQLYTNLLKNKK